MSGVRQTVRKAWAALFGSLEHLGLRSDSREVIVSRPDVFEQSSDGYILVDGDGVVHDTNAAATRLLGRDTVTRGEDLTATLPALDSVVGESTQDQTTVKPGSDPHAPPLVARRVPLSTDADAETLVVVREQTVTHRQQQRYRSFVEHSSEIVFILDADGTATFVGPSCRSVLGHEPTTVIGTDLLAKVHPDDREQVRRVMQQLLDDPKTTRELEFRVQTADDDWRIVDGRGRNLVDDPVVDGLLLTARDVTDRKQREHDLERQNERLQDFADVLSHDLRSPLQVATLSLGEAQRTGSAEAFEKTAQAHDRIETIIQNVLDLARQGQRISEPTTVSVAAVARDAWETVDTRPLTLSTDRDIDRDADRDRLQQLFENLFRNVAEHATPEDGDDDSAVTVTVGPIEPLHTSTRIGTQGDTGFYVADDGPGIPAEQRDEVFDSGFTTAATGTGFGLAIVAEIAEAHRWDLRVTDSCDGGARFEFTSRPSDQYLE